MPTAEAALPHSAALIWILLFPLVGCVSVGWLGRQWPRAMTATVACSAVFAALVMTLAALLSLPDAAGQGRAVVAPLVDWGPVGPFRVALGLLGDPLSLWFCLVVTGVGFLIHLYSVGYMADEPEIGRFFSQMNLFIFTMCLLVLSDNFLGLLFGWAGVGLSSYLLIGFWRERPAAVAAARKAFVINTIGDVAMILALLLLLHEFGTLSYAGVFAGVGGADPAVLTVVGFLLLAAAAAKSAQLPLHTWLPDAMQGPTPVSALIHAATMVTAGVYLVARAYPLFAAAPAAAQAVAVVGALSALAGATMACAQYDIKRVLAYSTMSQVGYMILATGVGAFTAGLFHFMTHAFFKALLFLAAGIVIHHLAGEQDVRKMGGLGRKLPFAYWTFLAGTLALAGVPLFSGFFSKDEILAGVLAAGHPWLWGIGVITAGITAFYMLRLFCLVFAGVPAADEAAAEHGAPGTMTVPVAVLAILAVVGGYIGIPGLTHVPAHFLGPWFELYPGGLLPEAAGGPSLFLSIVMAAAGIALGVALYRPDGVGRQEPTGGLHGLLARGYYLDEVYYLCAILPVWGLGRLFDQVGERWLIPGAGGVIARAAAAVGRSAALWQSGYLRRYALGIVAGVVVLLAYAVWPR